METRVAKHSRFERSQPIKRAIHFASAILLLLLELGATTKTFAEPARPNILFIFTDDQASWTTGYSGNAQAHTPNIDRLRREGVELPNAFVTSPVCSPSRATLMTGRYATELKIDDWIPPSTKIGLPTKVPVWPKLLRDAGYATGLVGKWHLGHIPQFHPTNFGYDHFMGLLTGGCPTANPTLEKQGKKQKFKGLTVDILTDHAIQFIEKNSKQSTARPFALSLHYRAPHAAFLPVSEEDWSHHKDHDSKVPDYPNLDEKRAKKNNREYLASVTSIDRNVGRLLKLLDDRKLADNTIVIFTSDHGYNIGHHGLMYKGNAYWLLKKAPPQHWPNIPGKRRPNMFDTSMRVPLVIRWPGVVKAGTTLNQTVDNTDWFPTLCAMAGVDISKDVASGLRGGDFTPLLRGKTMEWDNDLYGEYNMRNGAKTDMRVYRTPQWKLMTDHRNTTKSGESRVELYDLKNDPGETTNLYPPKMPQAKAAFEMLKTKLTAYQKRIGDPAAGK